MDIKHHKVWFSNGHMKTAALVLSSHDLKGKTVSDISRVFPTFEARKMVTLHVSEGYDSFEEAFKAPIRKAAERANCTDF